MSYPKLNLKKDYCTRFLLELTGFLDNSQYSALLGSGIFSDFKEGETNVLIRNYKLESGSQSLAYLTYWPKKKGKKPLMINRFEYRDAHGKLEGTTPVKIDFNKLYRFFEKNEFDKIGFAFASFEFPLKKFSPIIDLPYSREKLPIKKQIRIFGVDLMVESEKGNYRQSINLEKETIDQTVRILKLKDNLSAKLIKKTYDNCCEYSKDLLRKRRVK